MASDGQFPAVFGRVSPRGVPIRAVLVATALGAGYVLFRSFEQLTDAFVVGFFPFYVLAVLLAGLPVWAVWRWFGRRSARRR